MFFAGFPVCGQADEDDEANNPVLTDGGTVDGFFEQPRRFRLLARTCTIGHGSSGGPVVNDAGELIGIVIQRGPVDDTGAIPQAVVVEYAEALVTQAATVVAEGGSPPPATFVPPPATYVPPPSTFLPPPAPIDPSDVRVSSVVVSPGLGPGGPVGDARVFPAGVGQICVVWDVEGMPQGARHGAWWSVDGDVIVDERDLIWGRGSSDQDVHWCHPKDVGFVAPGQHVFRYYVEDSLVIEVGFLVEDRVFPLQVGSIGEVVAELQQALLALGYSVGPSGVDGEFGPDTESAVVMLQHQAGLPTTGVVDQWLFDEIIEAASCPECDD